MYVNMSVSLMKQSNDLMFGRNFTVKYSGASGAEWNCSVFKYVLMKLGSAIAFLWLSFRRVPRDVSWKLRHKYDYILNKTLRIVTADKSQTTEETILY